MNANVDDNILFVLILKRLTNRNTIIEEKKASKIMT